MPDPTDVEVCRLVFKIVCAVVDWPEFVTIKTFAEEDGVTIVIETHPDDNERLTGPDGRTLRSIRTITNGAGMKLGRRYAIVVSN